MVNKILFITLSNIGDCILSLPALDYLREKFPGSQLTVMASERSRAIFEKNPKVDKLVIYNRHAGLKGQFSLFCRLKKEKFKLVIDLRHSLFGLLLPVQYKILPLLAIPHKIRHMKDRHLYQAIRLSAGQLIGREYSGSRDFLSIQPQDEAYINRLLKESGVSSQDKIIVIASGAKSQLKRWPADKFAELIPLLADEFGVKVVLVGDKEDLSLNQYIVEHAKYPLIDLSAKTSIAQLAYLLKKAKALITNDSAVLHLASYLDLPVVAIFGPTDEEKYGPWSAIKAIVKKEIFCRPCLKAQCRFGHLKCMHLIRIEDVLGAVKNILTVPGQARGCAPGQSSLVWHPFRRILIVRTDRIGDVLLSTPVIKALRKNYPQAYIAMMVCAYARDIVEGNNYLDEVIIYDKDGKHKSCWSSFKFSLNLKKKKFDLALILHPTNRVHLVTFFAGIPKRIGYDRKLGFLLTDRMKHTKQFGAKHELEYNLDFLKYLCIEWQDQDKEPFMPIRPESEKYIEELFKQEGIKESDRLLAIHPAASCPSKVWPNERFAAVADRLVEKYGFKTLLVAGPKDIGITKSLLAKMQAPAVNLAGKTSVSQLASALKRCQLFISNDSGPVHIASALGVAVIAIFGRNQSGLSPRRWGPQGKNSRLIHKEIGCIECLAHNCRREFACLKAITVEDVLKAAESLLANIELI